MKITRFLLIFFVFGMIFLIDGIGVMAATSTVEFAVPVETKRMVYGLTLIRRDNTMTILPMEKEVKRAAVSPNGAKIAYVLRDGDHLKVYLCDSDGKNKKQAVDYGSDQRNFQDFVDVRFIKDGRYLLIIRYLKNQLSFVEYNTATGKPRFIQKVDWQGAPTTIYRPDIYKGGSLVFARTNNEGNKVIQQIWTVGAYDGKYELFLEIEAPPSIIDIVPDINHKKVFACGTQTRHISARDSLKDLLLITSSKDDPKTLAQDSMFGNLTISTDGKYVLWQSSLYTSGIKYKKMNVETKDVVVISSESEKEQEAEESVGTIVPSKAPAK